MIHNIEQDFVVMDPNKSACVERADSTLYERLDSQYAGFRDHELISCFEFDQDWSGWEIHPNGDEVVILLSGRIRFVLALEEGEKEICLETPGSYLIVPKNTWHTARASTKAKLLFVTPGEGTGHKPV